MTHLYDDVAERDAAIRHAEEKGRLEALQFATYSKAMAEQAKTSIAAREAQQRLVFEGLKTNPEGGIQAIGRGYAQARTFTREEVLTVLASRKALNPDLRIQQEIEVLERIFRRME